MNEGKFNNCYLPFECINYEDCAYCEPTGIMPCKHRDQKDPDSKEYECWSDKAKKATLLRILFPDLQGE